MFEDSLVESTGRIRTRSKWYAIGSSALEAALLATFLLIPCLYPASLPKEALSTPLVAPPPPSAPAQMPHAPSLRAASAVQLAGLVAPRVIPRHIDTGDNAPLTPPGMDLGLDKQGSGDVLGAIPLPGNPPPPPIVIRPKPSKPLRVSSGVAEGHILAPIQPVYPAIAKNARIQGTVVIEAIISRQGLIEQAHVISGQPILAQAALRALTQARYRPFKLNGDSVDVETTINFNFVLDR
jgi:periplasmic protein TonB